MYLYFVLGNHKEFTNRRRREMPSPKGILMPLGSRVLLSGSITSPATANYG